MTQYEVQATVKTQTKQPVAFRQVARDCIRGAFNKTYKVGKQHRLKTDLGVCFTLDVHMIQEPDHEEMGRDSTEMYITKQVDQVTITPRDTLTLDLTFVNVDDVGALDRTLVGEMLKDHAFWRWFVSSEPQTAVEAYNKFRAL